jgi:hypothetical protein
LLPNDRKRKNAKRQNGKASAHECSSGYQIERISNGNPALYDNPAVEGDWRVRRHKDGKASPVIFENYVRGLVVLASDTELGLSLLGGFPHFCPAKLLRRSDASTGFGAQGTANALDPIPVRMAQRVQCTPYLSHLLLEARVLLM